MSTTPPRNVIYCNDTGFLKGIVSLPYTDIILNFLVPDGNGGVTGPTPDPGDVQALQNGGKNVLISLGGDHTVFPSSAWQQFAQGVKGLVDHAVHHVTAYGLSGVDIDYEDDNGFAGPNGGGVYDGIQFLIELTNGLAQNLPPGASSPTHHSRPILVLMEAITPQAGQADAVNARVRRCRTRSMSVRAAA